jgi:3-oxoacyl-[acyl-carrier protein] reductase
MDLMAQGATDLLITGLTLTPPDIIVHVLGGSQGLTGTLLPSTDWARVWRLNLGIAHDLNAAFIPLMQRNKWGRIIHISSNATRIGSGYCPYTSAKAALEGYVKSVSREFSKDGVIITAVSPGIVYTPGRYFASLDEREQEEYFNKYIPTHRFGRAEEVAKTVAFLASEHSAYMAGSVVSIDGGAR